MELRRGSLLTYEHYNENGCYGIYQYRIIRNLKTQISRPNYALLDESFEILFELNLSELTVATITEKLQTLWDVRFLNKII